MLYTKREDIENRIIDLKFKYGNWLIYTFILFSIFFAFLNFIFKNNIFLFADFIKLFALVSIMFVINSLDRFDFVIIRKKISLLLLFFNFLSTLLIYEVVPISIISMFLATPICLYTVYNLKETIIKSVLYIVVSYASIYILSFLNYKFPISFTLSEQYSFLFNLIVFIFSFSTIIISLYFNSLISKCSVILDFLRVNPNFQDEFFEKNNFDFLELENEISISIDEKKELFLKIENYLKKNKAWKDPEYNLKQLSKDVGSNVTYVSRSINTITKKNFKTYINDYRLDEFILEIQSKPTSSLRDIYINVGFVNQSTFNRAFKIKFDISPQEYLKTTLNLTNT